MKEQEPALRPFERVPEELKEYPQWVNWRREDGRKVPVNPVTLGNAGIHWENTWASFDQATAIAIRHDLGLGFVLTPTDPYTCVDLDKCFESEGQVTERTRAILGLLSGWVELSPSQMGLHIWARNEQPLNRRTQGIEVYSFARWMTVTGRSNPQAPQEIPDRTAELEELVRRYFPTEVHRPAAVESTLDDDALWERLFTSRHGAFFESLFRGDTAVCHNDHSRAVIMLANQLARLTDLDAARVKRLLYQTGLVREKWEEKRGQSGTWIDHQILDAIRYVAGRKR